MIRRLLIAVSAIITAIGMSAEETSDMLLVENLSATQGEQIILPVLMNNTDPICAYSFELSLPEGVSLATDSQGQYVADLGNRTSDKSLAINFAGGVYYVAYVSFSSTPFSGNSGPVCNLTLDVSEKAAVDDLQFEISNIELAEPSLVKHNPENISAILTVLPKVRAEKVTPQSGDYQIMAIPSSIASGNTDIYVPIHFMNAGGVDDIQFTIQYPDGFDTRSSIIDEVKVYDNLIIEKSRFDTEENATLTVMSDDGKHFYFQNDDVDVVESDGDGLLLTLPVSVSNVDAGFYTVKLTNIEVEGIIFGGKVPKYTTHQLPDYYFTISVGESTDADPVLYGDFSTEMSKAVLEAVADANSLDLTSAVIDEKPVMNNPNAIVYVSNDISGDNVVIDNVCQNLVLSDNCAFSAPSGFTAVNATYSRTMDNDWGTICLPYDVESNAETEYYKVVSLDGSSLVIEKLDILPAGTPALIHKLASGNVTVESTSITVNGDMKGQTGEISMHGSYSKIRVEDPDAYYIKDNKFWRCNSYFYCGAFRAYFTVSSPNKAPAYTIGRSDETPVDVLTGESDSAIEGIYDMSGRKSTELMEGVNMIRLSNGDVKKVIIK